MQTPFQVLGLIPVALYWMSTIVTMQNDSQAESISDLWKPVLGSLNIKKKKIVTETLY